MFNSFSASYAGHVVDDDLGLQGTPANDRWYANEQLRKPLNGRWIFPGTLRPMAMTSSGWPSITSNPKATSVFPTC